ncbi:hypothetical protein GMST_34200 [Geomonas silvestris]|uniref:Uncharacterized protein n=1 Tax=Geomonas silvestris TaxID=2740184 RepID=A0A6V8MM22_9BACT|nr:hypothetical protein GMST_34200 [Geomonas silvestris]
MPSRTPPSLIAPAIPGAGTFSAGTGTTQETLIMFQPPLFPQQQAHLNT